MEIDSTLTTTQVEAVQAFIIKRRKLDNQLFEEIREVYSIYVEDSDLASLDSGISEVLGEVRINRSSLEDELLTPVHLSLQDVEDMARRGLIGGDRLISNE